MPKENEGGIVIEDDNFDLNEFPEDESGYEIIDDDNEGSNEPQVDPEIEAMKLKLKELEENNSSLKNQAIQNETLAKVLEGMSKNMKNNSSDKPKEDQSTLDIKALIENVDKNLVLKPGETLVQTLIPMLNELEKGYEKKLSERDKELGKIKLYQNEEYKAIYNTYNEEVEELAKKYKGTDAYTKAIKEVQLNHSDDIMNAKLETLKSELLEQLKREMSGESRGAQTNKIFTNVSSNLNSGKKKQVISKRDFEIVKQMAFQRSGIFDFDSDPVALEVAIEQAREEGLIK